MTLLYKFWKKARVYYTLSISRGGPGPRPPPPPGFATDYRLVSFEKNGLSYQENGSPHGQKDTPPPNMEIFPRCSEGGERILLLLSYGRLYMYNVYMTNNSYCNNLQSYKSQC